MPHEGFCLACWSHSDDRRQKPDQISRNSQCRRCWISPGRCSLAVRASSEAAQGGARQRRSGASGVMSGAASDHAPGFFAVTIADFFPRSGSRRGWPVIIGRRGAAGVLCIPPMGRSAARFCGVTTAGDLRQHSGHAFAGSPLRRLGRFDLAAALPLWTCSPPKQGLWRSVAR